LTLIYYGIYLINKNFGDYVKADIFEGNFFKSLKSEVIVKIIRINISSFL